MQTGTFWSYFKCELLSYLYSCKFSGPITDTQFLEQGPKCPHGHKTNTIECFNTLSFLEAYSNSKNCHVKGTVFPLLLTSREKKNKVIIHMSHVCSYKSQAEFSREPRKCSVWCDYTSEVKDIGASSSLTDFDRAWILFSMQ